MQQSYLEWKITPPPPKKTPQIVNLYTEVLSLRICAALFIMIAAARDFKVLLKKKNQHLMPFYFFLQDANSGVGHPHVNALQLWLTLASIDNGDTVLQS